MFTHHLKSHIQCEKAPKGTEINKISISTVNLLDYFYCPANKFHKALKMREGGGARRGCMQ